MAKLTTEEFISKAKAVHGDRYDYSKVEYVNNQTKVCIICKKHGEFWQRPLDHLKYTKGTVPFVYFFLAVCGLLLIFAPLFE